MTDKNISYLALVNILSSCFGLIHDEYSDFVLPNLENVSANKPVELVTIDAEWQLYGNYDPNTAYVENNVLCLTDADGSVDKFLVLDIRKELLSCPPEV
jgi:hypothetical protein